MRMHKLSKRVRKHICRYWRYWIVIQRMRVLGHWEFETELDDGTPFRFDMAALISPPGVVQ